MTTAETSLSPTSFPPAAPQLPPVLTIVATDAPDSGLSVEDLGSRIVAVAGRLAAATCRWLLLVAEFDARDGAEAFGLPSTARWLSHHCGISHRTAVEHIRVARTLQAFPRLSDSMAAGRLSYSHIRAITRIALPGEDDLVDGLVSLAENGTVGQVETMVRGLRTVEDQLPASEAISGRTRTPAGEHVLTGWGSDSRWSLHSRLDPERGAVVQSALDAVRSLASKDEDLTPADVLVRLAEIALAAMNDSATPPRTLRGDERAAVVIHIQADAIPQPSAPVPDDEGRPRSRERDPDNRTPRSRERDAPYARIADGPGLPDAVVQRLTCQGRVRVIVHRKHKDGRSTPLDVGRSRRVVTKRQLIALLARDGGCAHPGCGSRHHLEAHHVWHWIHGGPTDLWNLILLCERHHTARHRGDFTIHALGDQRFRFLRNDGRVLPDHTDPAALTDTTRPIEQDHDMPDDAAGNHWDGSRMDPHYAINVFSANRHLAHKQKQAQQESA